MQQQPNWKLPLTLAAILAISGPLVYWYEYSKKPADEKKAEQAKKLFQITDRPISKITLRNGEKTIEFKCLDLAQKLCKPGDNSKWEVESPNKLKADDASVNGLVSALNNLEPIDTIDLKDETATKRASLMQEYKLDPKARAAQTAREIELTFADGSGTEAWFGDQHPISQGYFTAIGTHPAKGRIQVGDEKVFVTPLYFKSNFDKTLTYWRDKKLMTLGSSEIERFELHGSHGTIPAARKDGQWMLTNAGEQVPGDIENIDSLLTSVTYLTAKEFASEHKNDAKARAALKGTHVALTITLKPKAPEKPITLTLHQRGSQAKPTAVFATVSNLDPLFELDAGTINRLDKSMKDLRLQKLITSLDRFTVKKIEVSGSPVGVKPISLHQKDSKWVLADESAASQDKVQKLLDHLSGNRIEEFLDGKAIPAGQDKGIRLALSDADGKVKRKLLFWRSGKKLYARDLLSKRDEAFRVDSSIQNALPWDRDFFAVKAAKPASAAPARKGT